MTAKPKLATFAEILIEEFMEPMGLTQATPAAAMGVPQMRVNALCND